MYSGQEFAGRAQCGLGQCGLGFLRAEGCGLRAGLKMRAECGLAGSASEAIDKTVLIIHFFLKKVAIY